MDLWIRSQDRDKLILTKGFETQYNNYDGGCQIFAVWQNNYQMIGKYKSKERALEVLDEIQHIFDLHIKNKSYQESDVILKANLLPKVYKMPKE